MPPQNRAYFVPMQSWEGRHEAFIQPIEGEYSFRVYDESGSPAARLDAYNQVTTELQSMIQDAVNAGKTLRALGSSWSLSAVPATEHRLVDTKALRIGFDLPAILIASGYAGDFEKLRFIECGASIHSINDYLFADDLSLKASGSNNGQTLAGAISTGTHGAAFKVGAIHDSVVGLHLILGPTKHVYLERASYPVVRPSFVTSLGADFIQDDTLFNAALVSFGSFGIIHGVMIEARERFLLHSFRRTEKFKDGLKAAIGSLDFSGLALPGPAEDLYHFEVVFNPNEGLPPDEAFTTYMFEEQWRDDYVPPPWDDGSAGLAPSALEVMADLVGHIPSPLNDLVKPLLNGQVRDRYKTSETIGTIRDLFRGEKTRGKTLSTGMGVSQEKALDALKVAFDTYKNFGAVLPVLIGFRFVKGTQALLGFTRFPATAVLEVDSVNTPQTQDFLTALWDNLSKAGIPFTLHWGKFNFYLNKARVESMYGGAVAQWKASCATLLENAAVRDVFTNKFMVDAGLDD